MESGLISVIVPVYNRENCIGRCLDSILAQRGVATEVIVIDDGSSDSSLDICKTYANNYTNIVVLSQDNTGPSVARTHGLAYAKGDYVSFVDSDDFIASDTFLLNLLSCLTQFSASICCCGYTRIEKGEERRYSLVQSDTEVHKKDYLRDTLLTPLGGYLWNRLYRRDVVAEHSFEPEYSFAEDLIFNAALFNNIKHVAYSSDCSYCYMDNENSITGGAKEFIVGGKWQFDSIIDRLRVVLPKNDPFIASLLSARAAQQAVNEVVLLSGKKEYSDLRQQLVKTCSLNKGSYALFERSRIKQILIYLIPVLPEWLIAVARKTFIDWG